MAANHSEMISTTRFLIPQNLNFDTKIMILCVLEVKILQFVHFWGSHFEIQDGCHPMILIIWAKPTICFLSPIMGLETNVMQEICQNLCFCHSQVTGSHIENGCHRKYLMSLTIMASDLGDLWSPNTGWMQWQRFLGRVHGWHTGPTKYYSTNG